MKKLLVYILLCLLTINSFAVKPPVKFGKIDIADLKMTTYEHDTSAVAVVLGEYGKYSDNSRTFYHILRIKILKKEGLVWANNTFGDMPKSSIRGITYNLVNGEITRDKLKNESVFQSHIVGDYFEIRIAMPNVKVGSVIDIEFSHPWVPYRWYFQRTIPVRWSELILEPTSYIQFRKTFSGYTNFYESDDYRWVTKDVPAFNEEPFTNSLYNYISKFELELVDINLPGFYRSFASTWESISRNLYNSSYFGDNINGNLFLNSVANNIESITTDKMEQLKLAHHEVKKIKWNEKSRLYCTYGDLNTPYKKQIGNSSDINLMLISLLRKLDFEANPVVMITRDRGIFPPYPSLSKLNYAICQTFVDGKEYLVDATEEFLPFTLLPHRCLNGRGRVILAEDKTEEVSLHPQGEYIENAILSLYINAELNITGTAQAKFSEYGAFFIRKNYDKRADENEYIESMEQDHPGLHIRTLEIENIDSIYQDVLLKLDITYHGGITKVGNMLYLQPMAYYTEKKNPYKVEERLYPVDYAYPRSKSYYIQYTIPEGYSIEELPSSLHIALPNKSASALYSVHQNANKITVTYKFNINQVTFLPNEYAGLKQLYSMIIDKHAEPIILKKN